MNRFYILLCLAAVLIPVHAYELYVAPTGSDQNPGTAALPLATVNGARLQISNLRAAGTLPSGTVTVYLHGGNYDQSSTVAFAAGDSGTAQSPVVYASYPGEQAHLTGAITLNPSWFTLVTSSSPVWTRLDPSAQGQVYQVSLGAYGITDYGTLQPRGFGLRAPAPMELFVNGQAMTLARWPNAGQPLATTATAPSSTQFTYAGTRPSRWTQATDIWMQGFWSQDWADFHVPVGSINPSTSTVNLASAPAQYGLGANRPYYAYNLLEELDTPGEYYIDRSSGILYYWPTAPLAGSVIQVSLLQNPIVTLTGTSYITFQDVIFEAARGALVTISGGNNNVLDHCMLRNAGQSGAQIAGGTGNGLTHNQVAFCGEEGVRLTGGGDRPSLTPANNYVTHSQFHGTGRIGWTYKPAINLEYGCGNQATNNLIDDLPHVAILFTGNNHLISYNEIWHVCQTTGDSGAIYCGRNWSYRGNQITYNYLHDISSSLGSADVNGIYLDDCMSGVAVASNIFYRISGTALFVGGGRDNLMTNNLIADCGTGHYNDDRGVGEIDDTAGDSWNLLASLSAENVQYQGGTWAAAYPACAAIPNSWSLLQQGLWRNPQNCVFSHNAGWGNSAWTFQSDSSGTGVFSVYADMSDDNAAQTALFTAAMAEDRSLRPATLNATSLTTFTPIPFSAIGPDESAEPTPTMAPATPLLTGSDFSAYEAGLSWTLLAGTTNSAATSFSVQYLNGSTWTTFEDLGGQVDFTAVSSLSAATTYTFRVVAANAAGSSISNSVAITTAAAPLTAGTAFRIEAENPLNVVTDLAINGTVGVADAEYDSVASVRMYDAGDQIRLNFTVATAGTYELGLRVRSGGSTGPTSFWPNGYSATLDGVPVTITGDPTSLSQLDSAYGGCFWGTMNTAPLTLAAGAHTVVLTANSNWSVADYLEVTAMLPATTSTVAATDGSVAISNAPSTATAATTTSSAASSSSTTSSSSSSGASTAAASGPASSASVFPSNADIGSVNTAGTTSFADGVYTLTGSGADIWNSTIGFQSAYQTLNGDGAIIARITSLTDTDPWTKAGVMIRNSSDPLAAYAFMLITPGYGAALQWGPGGGAASFSTAAFAGTAPYWLQLTRSGSTFTASCSPDGVTWTTVGTATIAMGASVEIGLALTSHNPSLVATATFASVSLTGVASEAASAPASTTTSGATTTSSSSAASGSAPTAATTAASANPGSTTASLTATTTGATGANASTTSSASSTVSGSTATAATTSGTSSTPSGSSASTTSTTAATTSPWTNADIGSVVIAGSSGESASGVFTLSGSGADIWGATVGFQSDYQTLNGDGAIVAQVTSVQNTSAWAKAGVMIRASSDAQAAYAAVFVTPGCGIAFQGGAGSGASCWSSGAIGAAPYWVRLTRTGSTFVADCSPDGVNWTNIGSAVVMMGTSVEVGLAVCSHNAGEAATATFASVTLNGAAQVAASTTSASTATSPTTAATASTTSSASIGSTAATPAAAATAATSTALSSPWTNSDIGSVAVAGTAIQSNGVYTLTGSGADIWNSTVGFQYASQAWTGDGTITAQVTSLQNTSSWAKAGVMMRAGTDATAPFVAVYVTPGNGVAFQWRNVDGWDCYSTSAGGTPPAWVRLTRSGATFTAYTSTDGINWTELGAAAITVANPVTFGLAVCSHNSGAATTATFSNVTLTNP